MSKFYRRRKRRERYSALGRYVLVFILGGVVALVAMPYFSDSVITRINDINQAINDQAAEFVPAAAAGQQALRSTGNGEFSVAEAVDLLKAIDKEYKPPVAAVSTAQAGKFRQFDIRGVTRPGTVWLNQVREWSGDGDRDISFKAPDSPYVLYWETEVDSTLGSQFSIHFEPSEKERNAEWVLAIGTLSLLGIQVTDGDRNARVIHENGTGEIHIRASGVSWTLIAATEP